MAARIFGEDIRSVITEVFGTDKDLYENRQHSSDKTLKGLVDFTLKSLFDGYGKVEVYSYEYGFFAVDKDLKVVRSFGIKKEHRDKKDRFFDEVRNILGDEFYAGVWNDNRNAIRFFEEFGGEKYVEYMGGVIYKFKQEEICL